jgi:hypothetical protein
MNLYYVHLKSSINTKNQNHQILLEREFVQLRLIPSVSNEFPREKICVPLIITVLEQ